MITFKRDKKDYEEGGGNIFANIEKTAVLQEARTFNETPVNPRKCTLTLTKILYLLNQGEQLGVTEATEAFFAMTKLFQSRDVILRRMVYLGIKELASVAEDVIIVTSSLTKDMTGKEDMYRAAAIRALCTITDATMLQAIERYMKEAIVDKNDAVSSAALVSSLHLSKTAGDVVKRWVNEAQEAINSDNIMVQYHALGVLYHIRKNDRLAVTKLLAKFTKISSYAGPNYRSPYAVCLLIRIACKLLEEEESSTSGNTSESPLFSFIESCLRHKSEMVIYEAVHAIVNLKRTTARELAPAVSVLELFCSSSSKPTLRFAAVRTLNKLAMSHPAVVTTCHMYLENLITDTNRNIATLAITTLLKTGAESSVERLMKQIAGFVSEISDEFKIVVVQAIRVLCLKFPRKHAVLMNFLSAMLRDEGGLDYKAAIADTIITAIEDNPDSKEAGLAHLCEFIEDCEHTSLAVRILHLLGREGPKTKHPSRYIRFIYNRVILENAAVRAAAVAAMAQFGALCPALKPNILVLLERCQMDCDDEVRDRATYYHSILMYDNPLLTNHYIVDTLQVSVTGLEKSLNQHLLAGAAEEFDMSAVPLAALVTDDNKTKAADITFTPAAPAKVTASREETFAEQLAEVEALKFIPGALFHSSDSVELTESETEYVVKCVKHCFARHLVLQFDVVNTLSDQLLENVRVVVEPAEGFKIVAEVSIPKLLYGETGHCYVAFEFPPDLVSSVGTFGATLKFIVKDCDPVTGLPDTDEGYQDEYMVEDVEVTVADQVQKTTKANFGLAWEEATSSGYHELEDTYGLEAMKTIEQAVNTIVSFLGLAVADKSDKVPEGKASHSLFLSGAFRGGHQILVGAKLALSTSDGVAIRLTVRATDPEVAELVASTFG